MAMRKGGGIEPFVLAAVSHHFTNVIALQEAKKLPYRHPILVAIIWGQKHGLQIANGVI